MQDPHDTDSTLHTRARERSVSYRSHPEKKKRDLDHLPIAFRSGFPSASKRLGEEINDGALRLVNKLDITIAEKLEVGGVRRPAREAYTKNHWVGYTAFSSDCYEAGVPRLQRERILASVYNSG